MTEERGYILVGGGAFARELHDWFGPVLRESGSGFLGYIDDGDAPMRAAGHDLPQLGSIASFEPDQQHHLVMAVTHPASKRQLAARLGAENFATLVHPTAWVSASARLERGAVVGVFANVSANAVVGELATVNGHSSVGHDAELGPFSTLSSYVDLTGYSRTGPDCFLGSGARLLPRVGIGAGCTVGAGATVVRSVEAGVTLFAAPARRL